MKVLVLGGYGVFGGRLAQLLSDCADIELIICGRSLAKAQRFCETYIGRPSIVAFQLDRNDITSGLALLRPDLVVDASGPFQDYGAERYKVIEACIAAKVNYLDFADAADFVFGISQFDDRARSAGIYVLSGVSSFPVLTAAVLRHLAKDMEIASVHGGIAPSPYAGIGLNVMKAVIGYAGAPVKLLRGGVPANGTGLAESMRYTVAPPGRLPLRNIRFSLVDVPDLQVVPPEHPTMTDIWMGAGPVPEILHRLLNLLAKARAALNLPSLAPLSPLFYTVLNLMRFGEHRGGMFIRARGLAEGREAERSWHLLAEGDDGPYIPSMAIEAIIRKASKGDRPLPGARPATNALKLDDYDELFKGRAITTGFRDEGSDRPLYRRVLNTAFDALPAVVRSLHDSRETRTWQGVAQVRRGRGIAVRAVCAVVGFPRSGADVPVTVTLKPEGDAERWTRTFAARTFSSLQSCGTGRDEHLVVERFGIAAFSLALVTEDGRLILVPRRWSLLGIPMPTALLPRGLSYESQANGQFRFDVNITAPGIGLIVAYNGWLEPMARTH